MRGSNARDEGKGRGFGHGRTQDGVLQVGISPAAKRQHGLPLFREPGCDQAGDCSDSRGPVLCLGSGPTPRQQLLLSTGSSQLPLPGV